MTFIQRARNGERLKVVYALACRLGFHRWEVCQEAFLTNNGRSVPVIAWRQCERCAKSKLIHILQ